MSRKADPRIQRSRDSFEQALLELMETKDFKKITVQEISKKSALNRATFYLHYFDKEDLLEQMMEAAIKDLKSNLEIHDFEFNYSFAEPHPTLIRLFEIIMDDSKFYKIMLAEEKVPYFAEAMENIIRDMIVEGTTYMIKDKIDYRVPAEISISYFVSAYFGMIIWWLKQDMPYTAKYMATQLTILSTVGPYMNNPYISK